MPDAAEEPKVFALDPACDYVVIAVHRERDAVNVHVTNDAWKADRTEMYLHRAMLYVQHVLLVRRTEKAVAERDPLALLGRARG